MAAIQVDCPVAISQCGDCGVFNQVPNGGYITHTIISDGFNNLGVCSITGANLYYDQFESYNGFWDASYYTTVTNLTGIAIKCIFIVNGVQSGSPTVIGNASSANIYGNSSWTLSDDVQLVIIPN